MKQRTSEWLDKSRQTDDDYHDRQFREPYRSTVAFCDWLDATGLMRADSRARILDIGAGAGANIAYMSRRYPHAEFVGVDLNEELVAQGNAYFDAKGNARCRMEVGDIYALDDRYVGGFDGLVSYQTLSWLPEFSAPLREFARLSPGWIALTSLFYAGPVSCRTEVTEYDADLQPKKNSYYNVYALPVVERLLAGAGYGGFDAVPFEIDIDLPKPDAPRMATYTERSGTGGRLQISGPLLMPWHFVAARRNASA